MNDTPRGFSKYPTWSNFVVILLFIATISSWFISYGAKKEQIKNLGSDIDDMTTRLNDLEKWQKEWPLKGELIMDREQNSKLKELTGRLNRLEGKVGR